ncbi:protein TIC236, chloroplastic isoform X2 [Diospyros lotus]|uniref:protein TIC236, chloroplastic isoform X2 n=1 Tax=Diospyros lotus TaxID=55363 RepID=UPI00225A182F|nr:protein TIC236, chloroplastic isoform X2 [Diospyros lotus]
MSTGLHSPFLGFPLECYLNKRNKGNLFYRDRTKLPRREFFSCKCVKQSNWFSQGIRFSHFCGRNAELLWKNLGWRGGLIVKRITEPFYGDKALVRSLAPLWEEGLLLIRCSVFCAVISGVCLLVWYGQAKAKTFVEAKLLPSVCSVLSEYIEREIDFGKVRRISPLSITLESCSFGPHSEEFSCGEVPTVKLRILPFASLKRGKIVIDAVLSNPSLLIVQKKNYTWLGIPYSDGSLSRHLSTEEGIGHRTKIRRVAREEVAACYDKERDDAAREAAKMGYILSEKRSHALEGDMKDNANHPAGLATSESFFCMDERLHWRDHHCMDAGVEYELKHADLEKAFGVNIPGEGVKFWSRFVPGPIRHKFKRKANGRDVSVSGFTAKSRILERSALAAHAYFLGLSDGKSGDPNQPYGDNFLNIKTGLSKSEGDASGSLAVRSNYEENVAADYQNGETNFGGGKTQEHGKVEAAGDCLTGGGISELKNKTIDPDYRQQSGIQPFCDEKQSDPDEKHPEDQVNDFVFLRDPFLMTVGRLLKIRDSSDKIPSIAFRSAINDGSNVHGGKLEFDGTISNVDTPGNSSRLEDQILESLDNKSIDQGAHKFQGSAIKKLESLLAVNPALPIWPSSLNLGLPSLHRNLQELWSFYLAGPAQSLKSEMGPKVEDIISELAEVDEGQTSQIEKMLPVILDSVHFKEGTLMLLAYGDREPREMNNVNGHVKFQNHYGRVHVQLSGNCSMWRSDVSSQDGGWLSTDVFVDIVDQKWHANLKVMNLFAPLFERILEIPIMWSNGRATGEVHVCMSRGETFPNLHGQLDVTGLSFQIYDAPSWFSDMSASLCFRGQRIFLHNASGWFGSVPLEASGDFGINPEEGEFHLMCQVPCVEVNALMKAFKMKPFLFPLAGSVTAVFNCQGPLDAPIFVGSGLVSRKIANLVSDFPASFASEAMMKNKDAGAVAAIDRIPFSYVSANFTFNTDNCVADLYGIRASLVDGGEIRGAGNAWVCPEGEVDESAMDVNFSGNLCFDNIVKRYLPSHLRLMPFKLGDLNGETKVSGSLLKPRFDIKWTAPKAEGSFNDARGDIIISHDYITVNSSSVAFELSAKVQTSYPDEYWLNRKEYDVKAVMPIIVEGVELDLRMRSFEFFSFVSSYAFDSLRPMHLKATGRLKFQGKVIKPFEVTDEQFFCSNMTMEDVQVKDKQDTHSLVGEVSISGLKLNQLMLAPQLLGTLSISRECIKLDATGRPDECLAVEVGGALQPSAEENLTRKVLSFSLQKGHLRANICYRPLHSANLEVRHLPLDELELASLRGTLQRAEIQLNFQKRRGHGVLSVLRPKFSGVLGEALDVAARWSGDVITVEKAVLEQCSSQYELQGEYVLPGTRDRNSALKERGSLFERAMAGHLGSVISSMGRWRMRLIVPRAEIAEMLPLARLLRSTDPAVLSRSKDLFIQSLQSVGLYGESLQNLLSEIQGHSTAPNEVVLEELSLPGLSELKGRWNGNLDASGGGNGDTMAEFDFHGEEWEWGTYKTQRLLAVGAYSNDDGLRLEKMFIQKDNATIHADGTLLGPKTNLHFAVLNFPISLVPTLVQVIESSATEAVHSLRQLLAPIRGILHMEGDLRGNLAKPECDVQVRLLDGAIGGIDLGRAEIVASLTSTSRFLFNANFEPVIQSGHVHIQGSVPVTLVQNNMSEEEKMEREKSEATWSPGWSKERSRGSADEVTDKKASRDRNEEGWDTQLAEGLKGLNWNILDVGEVRVDADIKDGGMMLLTALSPYANWLHGSADVMLQVRGTVEQPVLDGSAYFHRATVSSPVLRKPLSNLGGTVNVNSNRLCIVALESRVSRKGKLSVKGNLPLRTSEASLGDKINLKCEFFEVRAKNVLSGQVDTHLQISGSILQPNISGEIKLSHGEAYLPHDKGSGAAPSNKMASNQSRLSNDGHDKVVASKYVSRFFSFKPADFRAAFYQPPGKQGVVEKEMGQENSKPKLDIRLTDLKLVLGPELRIVYPLILNFAVSGELELNGMAHPKWIKPKGILTFENGDINLVATQVRLKREHLNVAKFEPDYGLDPMLDLALVGSEWQFRIQSRASNWQDKLVVTSTRSVEQDVLSPTEAARVFESQLAESILEGDGQLAFKKLATATLETLMPRIEGKGEFGQARWRLVYAPQIPSLLSLDPTVDPLKSLASNISFGTEVEVQLGKHLQASVVRQMKDSEMAMQWTLIYQLTSRLRVLLQSAPSKRLLFEYSTTSQD